MDAVWGLFHFFGWAILVTILTNVSCALLGTFLVLRRMSLFGDALSHAVLPGIVIGYTISHSLSSPTLFISIIIAPTISSHP